MTSLTTFYLSGITGKEVFDADGEAIGRIRDLLISNAFSGTGDSNQQRVIGIRLKVRKDIRYYSFDTFRVVKAREMISVTLSLIHI